MIDFAGLVGKITGKTAALSTGVEPGVATGGEFAALVAFAAQAGAESGQPKLKLVVDNSMLPTSETSEAAMAAMLGQMTAETSDAEPASTDKAPGEDGESEAKGDQGGQSGHFTIPMPIVAAWSAVPVQPAPQAETKGDALVDGVAALGLATSGGAADAALARSTAQDSAEPQPDATAATGQQLPANHHALLATALRALSPHSRADTAASKADAAVQIGAAAAVATSDEAQPMPGGKSTSSATASARLAESAAPGAAAPSPLRAIVDALPPVIQSELGTPAVRGVSGPSAGEALGDQVIDMGVSGQWIDRMAREISSLAEGNGHSRFTLNPPHLGKLTVDLWQDGGATNVRLLTETDEAAQRLTEGRPALQADARIAALSLGAITVEKSSATADSSARDQGSTQRQAGDFFGQSQQQQNDGRAQTGAGNARASDWVRGPARNDDNQTQDASAPVPDRVANGRVRFA